VKRVRGMAGMAAARGSAVAPPPCQPPVISRLGREPARSGIPTSERELVVGSHLPLLLRCLVQHRLDGDDPVDGIQFLQHEADCRLGSSRLRQPVPSLAWVRINLGLRSVPLLRLRLCAQRLQQVDSAGEVAPLLFQWLTGGVVRKDGERGVDCRGFTAGFYLAI
jgi:hypothetical protein